MEEITIKTVFVQSELSINEDDELDVMMSCGVRKRGKWHSVSEVWGSCVSDWQTLA